VIRYQILILDNFGNSLTIAKQGILGDILVFLIQSQHSAKPPTR